MAEQLPKTPDQFDRELDFSWIFKFMGVIAVTAIIGTASYPAINNLGAAGMIFCEQTQHLRIGQRRPGGNEAQGHRVPHGQHVGSEDDEVDRVDPEEGLRDGFHVGGDEQQGDHHDHPEEHQPLEARLKVDLHGPRARIAPRRRVPPGRQRPS